MSPPLIRRLSDAVRRRNGQLEFDALLKAGLGVLFSCLTFGFVFWGGWFLAIMLGWPFGLDAYQFAAILTGLFMGVATWSAWRQVNPLAGLKPMSDRDMVTALISQATGTMLYANPRLGSRGMALVLIAGPANLFDAVSIWAHRLRADDRLIEEAARLLAKCRDECSIERVRAPAAAVLLRRLALIKVTRRGESATLVLTEKGLALLGKTRA